MSEREQLLERLVSGETDTRDPAVQRLFARDPSARVELEALRDLELSLERQGDRARDVVEASRGLRAEGEARRVLAGVRRLASREPTPARTPLRRLNPAWIALAAAALVALAWGWWARSNTPEPEIKLGTESSQALAIGSPVLGVHAYGPFVWTGLRSRGDFFEVRVYDATVPGAEPILESGTVLEFTWDPGAEVLSSLPAKIQWTLTRFNSSRVQVESESAEAWLDP